MKKPKTTKAAILVEQKSPLVIADIDLPLRLEYGQVLVKVVCSGICGSQIGEIDGVKGPDAFLPHLLGHEGGGIVEEIGPGVTKVKERDHVVMHWRKGAGIEAPTPQYKWGDKTVNAGWITTFNEYAVVSENRLTPIPDDIDFEIAALMGCAVTTGLGVVSNNAKIKIGESVVVFGAGGVGLNVIQGARLVSAYPIIAVDLYDNKLEMARLMGATHVINSSRTEPRDKVLQLVGASYADVVIDNTGLPEVIRLAYELTRPGGKTILVGVPKKGDNVSIYTLPLHFGKIITGSHGGETNPTEDIPRYLKVYKARILELQNLITHRFNLSEINETIGLMKSGTVSGRCIIRMSD